MMIRQLSSESAAPLGLMELYGEFDWLPFLIHSHCSHSAILGLKPALKNDIKLSV